MRRIHAVFFVAEIVAYLRSGLNVPQDPFHWHLSQVTVRNYPCLIWYHIRSRIDTTVSPNSLYCGSTVSLYSGGSGRKTGYPEYFHRSREFHREKFSTVLRLVQDSFIGNSYQFLIIRQPTVQCFTVLRNNVHRGKMRKEIGRTKEITKNTKCMD
jgi:hypothetical protein